MKFNFYLDDQTAKELDRTAKKLGETRSGLIRKALREWLDKKTPGSLGWPSLILEWQGVPDTPPFESYRGELLPPRWLGLEDWHAGMPRSALGCQIDVARETFAERNVL